MERSPGNINELKKKKSRKIHRILYQCGGENLLKTILSSCLMLLICRHCAFQGCRLNWAWLLKRGVEVPGTGRQTGTHIGGWDPRGL